MEPSGSAASDCSCLPQCESLVCVFPVLRKAQTAEYVCLWLGLLNGMNFVGRATWRGLTQGDANCFAMSYPCRFSARESPSLRRLLKLQLQNYVK